MLCWCLGVGEAGRGVNILQYKQPQTSCKENSTSECAPTNKKRSGCSKQLHVHSCCQLWGVTIEDQNGSAGQGWLRELRFGYLGKQLWAPTLSNVRWVGDCSCLSVQGRQGSQQPQLQAKKNAIEEATQRP